MVAMRLDRPQPVEQEPLAPVTQEAPSPGPYNLRVRVDVCGVCRTDLHIVEGELPLPKLPIVPGHQIVGRVDAVGPRQTRFRPGERVGVGWLNSTCRHCRYCQDGQENLCPEARFTGLDVDGGYARYMLVHEDFAFHLPEAFADEHAAPLLCAGIIGYRSLKLSAIAPGGRLGLYGFGGSAHLAIQVARHWQCEVYVFTRSQEHRRHAESLGAVWTGSAKEQPPVLLDAGIIFAPAGWIIPLALAHLRPGSALAINAIHMSPIPEMPYDLIYGERLLRSVANFTRQDAREFLELAAGIPIRTDVEQFPLSQANAALKKLKASKLRGAAVLAAAI